MQYVKLKNMKSYTHRILEENGYKIGREIVDDDGNRLFTIIPISGSGPTKYSYPGETLKDFIGRIFGLSYDIKGGVANAV